MSFQFKPAVRENVGLLIGLMGGTGSGKTYTAMRLAAGIAGDKPFAVIDTEAGRALHYADMFRFDHGIMRAPFSPEAYADAINAADAAGYPVIVVDSFSHEHAGEGGILDMHETELDRMAGVDNWQKREACKMAAWIKPKMGHKAMVQKLLQVRAHLILCFRAEEKVEMSREGGKTVIKPKLSPTGLNGWTPVCEKNLPFELTCSFLLTSDAPGVPRPIKLQEQHRQLFPAGEVVTEAAGKRIAEWASGCTKPAASVSPVLLAGVLEAIEAASDAAALKRAGELASKLPTDSDREVARIAYNMRRAKNSDALDAAADLINSVTDDVAKTMLAAVYRRISEAFSQSKE